MVAVLGGGIAGLAAATMLASRGMQVCVVEAASRLGGRLHSFSENGDSLDNGQHVLVEACTSTMSWLKLVGIADPDAMFFRITDLPFFSSRGRRGSFRMQGRLGKGDVLFGVLGYSLLSWSDRTDVLLGLSKMRKAPTKFLSDILARGNVLPIRYFWEPICRAFFNRELSEVTGGELRSLVDNWTKAPAVLVPKESLSLTFLQPAIHRLSLQDVPVYTSARVMALEMNNDHVTSLVCTNGRKIRISSAISTVTPDVLSKIAGFTGKYCPQSIISVYLWHEAHDGERMAAFVDSVGQWIFAKNKCLSQITISGADRFQEWSRHQLVEAIKTDLRRCIPEFPTESIRNWKIIKERKATWKTKERVMPGHSLRSNFFLAGDWTDTGLPSSVESAIRSAEIAVQKVMEFQSC